MKYITLHIIFFAFCSYAFAQQSLSTDYTVLSNAATGALHATALLTTEGKLNCYADKIPSKVLVTVTESGTLDIYDWNISNRDASVYKKSFEAISTTNFSLDISNLQLTAYYEIKIELFNKYDKLPAIIVLRKNNTAETRMIRRHTQIDKQDFYPHMRKQDILRRERNTFWNAAAQRCYVRISTNGDFRHRAVVGLFVGGAQTVPLNTAYDDRTPGELLKRIDSMVNNMLLCKSAKVPDKTAEVNEVIGKYTDRISNADADTAMFAPVVYLVYAKSADGIVKLHYIASAGWGKNKTVIDALDKLFKQPNIY